MVSFAIQPLLPLRKIPKYPLDRKLSGSYGLDDAEKRKILPPPGFELQHFDLPSRSQSLYRLHYPGLEGNKEIWNFGAKNP
jgi:hypothetical protein